MTTSADTAFELVDRIRRKAPEYLDLLVAETDDEFEKAFEAVLGKAVSQLEADSKRFVKLDEDGLSSVLAMALSVPGLTVTRETNSNGHVDLTIEADHCVPPRRKLGEAKIYRGPKYHISGLEQLLGRYTTGREGRGLLVAYFRDRDISGLITALRHMMDTEKPCAQPMQFLIADTFTDSLARLTGDEQKAVKMTAFDLQMQPDSPGFSFHKLERAKDKLFWSVRVNADVRLIVHRTDASLLLCYVDHHDRAYAWAERRKLETHPATGAAQIIELRESVRKIVVPTYVQTATPNAATRPLSGTSDDLLLGYGVPAEWLKDVREADEDGLLALASHLPAEAAEAVLDLATGGTPLVARAEPTTAGVTANPFTHPDAQRRFRVVTRVEELERALEAPWEKWAVFLHPEQRQLVTRDYNGPARVTGSAGTGKTVVALHRAVHLARTMPQGRILLATFSDPLAHALRANVKRLIGNEPRLIERLEVHAMSALGLRLHQAQLGPVRLASSEDINTLLREASEATGNHKFSPLFLRTEWEQVVDAWQLETWEAYRDVQRLGRRTRVPEARRAVLWAIFERVRAGLKSRGLMTESAVFQALADAQASRPPAFDAAVVDEAQDVSIAQLRFLGSLGGSRPNGLFFTGDLGQRIFQQPFSWKALGVDVRGRSKTLRVNYRTSHQIREQADRLLGPEMSDVDGNREDRRYHLGLQRAASRDSHLSVRARGDRGHRRLVAVSRR